VALGRARRRSPGGRLLAALAAAGRPLHLPGAQESRAARRRRERAERRTLGLAVLAVGTGGAVVAGELARVAAREPTTPDLPLTAARDALEVAVEGYRGGSRREHALLNLLLSFSGTWAFARLATHVIRRRRRFGPFRDVVVGGQHIHHFVPGIALAFLAGAVSLLSPDEGLDPVLAVHFGAGVALTLDESALLLKLDDVYWSEEGIVSVQVGFATIVLLSTLALVLRVLRRGEREVLEP
jgi:hypothetical protein